MRRSGLFLGFWFDTKGRKLRRIRRDEYGELYRLVALGRRLGLHKEGLR
jgi:hypothetical protein